MGSEMEVIKVKKAPQEGKRQRENPGLNPTPEYRTNATILACYTRLSGPMYRHYGGGDQLAGAGLHGFDLETRYSHGTRTKRSRCPACVFRTTSLAEGPEIVEHAAAVRGVLVDISHFTNSI